MRRWIIGAGLLGWGMLGMGGGCYFDMNDMKALPSESTPSYSNGGAGQGGSAGMSVGGMGGGGSDNGSGGMGGTPTTGQGGMGGTITPATCPINFTEVAPGVATFYPTANGSCYALVKPHIKKTWDYAKWICEQNKMHLAIINSKAEHEFIYTSIIASGGSPEAWIAARRKENETWKWIVGNNEYGWPMNQTSEKCMQDGTDPACYWASGEPNETPSDDNPVCARIKPDGWFWNHYCTEKYDFLCELDAPNASLP